VTVNVPANARKKVAVVGARGYSGLELVRLLLQHPEAELAACLANEASSFSLADYLPEHAAAKVPVLPLSRLEELLPSLDTVFLATPAEASLELAPRLLAGGVHVIDLSGAFRLQEGSEAERSARYELWYKAKHPHPALTAQAVYGLVPFQKKPLAGRGKTLVSNPGCYATAVLMAITPLLKAGAIEPASLVIDAKSGTSGAGRKASEAQLFTEVSGECLPYRVGRHQHLPEISEWAKAFSGRAIDPFFNTHLLPVRRGIIASVYASLAPGKTAADAASAYAEAFAGYPLARVTQLDAAASGQLSPQLALSLKRVTGTARVHIGFQAVGTKLYVFSLIDNLMKGAASQALENFNLLHDLPAATGLERLEGTL